MTPESVREYDSWNQEKDTRDRKQTAETKKQANEQAVRRLHETYVNDAVVSSSAASADRVLLALKSDPPDTQGDALPGLLADLLAKKDKRPVSGAFKSAFYTGGLFERTLERGPVGPGAAPVARRCPWMSALVQGELFGSVENRL